MRKSELQVGKIYIVEKQRRNSNKKHWHWEVFIPIEKDKTNFSTFSINLNSGSNYVSNTKQWSVSVLNSEFKEISMHKCFKLIFDEKEWKDL